LAEGNPIELVAQLIISCALEIYSIVFATVGGATFVSREKFLLMAFM